ncbi:hypothetical protein U1Q18_000469, partial [Sarracenia purpurea var. burkii]
DLDGGGRPGALPSGEVFASTRLVIDHSGSRLEITDLAIESILIGCETWLCRTDCLAWPEHIRQRRERRRE